MNEKIVSRIHQVVENIEDFDNISAKKLAELSFTSPPTISRFVKLQGYKNFMEYKLAIKAEKEMSYKKVNAQIFDSWANRLSVSFETLGPSIQLSANLLAQNKIYVWCKREYDGIAKEFTYLLSRSGYSAVNIDDYFQIEQLDPQTDIVLSIGKIPPDLYRKNLQYICIVYTNFVDTTDGNNITTLKVMPLKYHKYDTLNINYRITCIQLLLGMLCEQLCLHKEKDDNENLLR